MGKVRNSANRLGFHYGLFSFLFIITKFNFITMKIKINQNEAWIIQMLTDKFGLTKKQAIEKLKEFKTK
jgi:hypothetical protein